MLSLDDESMAALMRLSQPLLPSQRGQFLRDVAARLARVELGDGVVSRVAREVQKRYLNGTSAAVAEGLKLFEEKAETAKRRRK